MTAETTTVGSIKGELDLDITKWIRKIDEAEAKAKELEGTHATFEIVAENVKALEAIEEVKADSDELEATPATVHVEVNRTAAIAQLEETRAAAAKPIVQTVQVRTEGALTIGNPGSEGGFVDGTLRPSAMGAAPESAMMATERLTGANGDLVASYLAVERAAAAATPIYSAETEQALNIAVAKIRLANANKTAADAEKAYVAVLDDEKASNAAVAAAERGAVEARQAAVAASDDLARATAEAGDAEADLGRKVDDTSSKLKRSGDGVGDWRADLIGALVAVAAAAPPVVAGAIGITSAFGILGVAGVLAVAGIKAEMAAGSVQGETYSAIVAGLKSDLTDLEKTAANGILPGVQTSVDLLDEQMPAIATETGHFADELGGIVPTGLQAVVTMLERAEPLLDDGADYLARLVDGLDGYAQGNGFESFLDYAREELPTVESLLSDVGHTAEDFLKSWAEAGAPALTVVDDLVKGIGDVLNVTGPLLPLTIALMGAWKASALIGGVLAPALDVARTAMSGLGAATEVTTEALAGEAIAEDVATDGVNLIPQAAAAAGGAALLAGVGLTGALTPSAASSAAASTKQPTAAPYGGGDTSYNGFGAGATANTAAAAAANQAGSAYAGEAGAVRSANAMLTAQVAVANAAAAAQKKASTAAEGLESSEDSAKDAISGLSATVKTNGLSLDDNTAKGRANREQILAAVQAAQAYGAEVTKVTGSTAQGSVATDKMALSLEHTMQSLGFSKQSAQEYIEKLLGIPKGISTEVALKDAEAASQLATIKKDAEQLDGTTATVYVSLREAGLSGGAAQQAAKWASEAHAYGGTAGEYLRAAGGATVSGLGTSSSDSVRAMLSNGEEVTSNAYGQASTFRPVLKAINSQQVRTMSDLAGMLGGNRGPVVNKTINVGGVHQHNPVAVDPIQAAEDMSQTITAYAGLL